MRLFCSNQHAVPAKGGSRFRASKAAESRRGKTMRDVFPRTPGRGLRQIEARLHCLAAPVAEDRYRIQPAADAILCKVAALHPAGRLVQPRGHAGRNCSALGNGRGDILQAKYVARNRICQETRGLRLHQSLQGSDAAILRRIASAFLAEFMAILRNQSRPVCSRIAHCCNTRRGSGGKRPASYEKRRSLPRRLCPPKWVEDPARKRLPLAGTACHRSRQCSKRLPTLPGCFVRAVPAPCRMHPLRPASSAHTKKARPTPSLFS